MSWILEFARTVTAESVTETAAVEVTIAVVGVAVALFAAGVILSRRVYVSAALRAGGTAVAFAVLAFHVHDQNWLTGWDESVTSWFIGHRTPVLDTAAVIVTDLGSPVATVVLAVVVAALLAWRARSPLPGLVVVGTVGAAAVASTVLKSTVERTRPPGPVELITETDYSFPSGHVTGTAALFGITAVVLTVGRSRYLRAVAAMIVASVVVLVASTRLYLGVHWLTDVIGGALLAACFVSAGAAVLSGMSTRALPGDSADPDRRAHRPPAASEITSTQV